MTVKTRIQTFKEAYTFDYPWAIELADMQEDVFWSAREIEVAKDIQDMRVNMTPAEQHGVITTLKLFTLYELVAGRDYWLGRVMRRFPRPDIQRMASTFGYFELNVHAPFYNKINEALMLNTDEFYTDYVNNPVLKERMDFVESVVSHKDDLVSLGAFSMVEGAVLYSSFAFLKHFQAARTETKLSNVVRGINFSVRDENLHSLGGARLYRELLQERKIAGELDIAKEWAIKTKLDHTAREIAEHEFAIVDMIFEKGDIVGINADDMKTFVKSRINLCLSHLGIEPVFEKAESNPIAEWFYKNINGVQFNDFFAGIGNSYKRSWNEDGFVWKV